MAAKQGEPGDGLFKKRQRSLERDGRNTSSNEPKMIRSRIFIGNLDEKVLRPDLESVFKSYGKIIGVSLHKNFGFVQFDNEESAHKAVAEQDGKTIKGRKAEVNMVSERMKEPISRRARSRSPRPSRFSRERDMDFRMRRRRSPPLPPPPRFRGPPDRFRDPFFRPPPPGYLDDMDDPFEMYPPEPRMYMREPPLPPPPPRRPPFGSPDFLPPRRERFGPDFYDELDRERMRERVREREPHSPPPSRLPPPPPPPPPPSLPPPERSRPHMEIIVVNRLQRDYAESVRQKTEALGLNVSIVQLSLTVSLTAAMENAAQRGLLYTVIITAQHETHRSITLTILRGRNPQEHKNMPLGDALGLIERDFNNYLYGPSRDSLPPPSAAASASPARSSVTSLMTRAASGEQLNESELSMLISSLQQQQAKPTSGRPLAALGGGGSSSHAVESSMQRQQADLQAKILSLLGSSAVVPASKPASSPSPATAGRSGYGNASRYTEDTLYGSDYSYTDRYRQPSYGGFH